MWQINHFSFSTWGPTTEPWKVCTVTQVEEVKTWDTNKNDAHSSLYNHNDPYIFGKKFPWASIPVIPLVFLRLSRYPSTSSLLSQLLERLQEIHQALHISIIPLMVAGYCWNKTNQSLLAFIPIFNSWTCKHVYGCWINGILLQRTAVQHEITLDFKQERMVIFIGLHGTNTRMRPPALIIKLRQRINSSQIFFRE